MVIRAKGLTWAPYTSGGSGAAIVYGTGSAEQDLVVKIDQSEDRNDGSFSADDHVIDRDNSASGATVSIEVADLPDSMLEDLLGMVKGTDSLSMTTEEAPYVGVGFIYGKVHCGTKTWKAFWYHKVQFSRGSRSFNTHGESTEYQTESIEGKAVAVSLTSGGQDVFYEESLTLTSESAARSWLNGRAGIS